MNRENKFVPWAKPTTVTEGMYWPEGQALPWFAAPANPIDTVNVKFLNEAAMSMLSALQGILSKKQPRLYLDGVKAEREEGCDVWPQVMGLARNEFKDLFELLRKYQGEVSGVVLYDDKENKHMRNLACTVAGLKDALPVELGQYPSLARNGVNLPVVCDLTGLKLRTAVETYNYLYDNYWKDCSRRVMVSMDPIDHAGYVRDMAAACGAAVVWLDAREKDEEEVLHKFLGDLTAGKSILLGWYPEERSGIGAGTAHGVSTIPSDYYENSTVHAGMPHHIRIPTVPKMPELENKVYLALFLSDGDNVQYCQHVMHMLWQDKDRGSIPINWTVSPGLADIGPSILNYYYDTATPNDFFSSGPSGLGYALIYDSHHERLYLQDKDLTDGYVRLSEQYLNKTGIRAITIWDILNDVHFESYEKHARTLYGLTLEDWFQKPAPLTLHVEKGRLPFVPNYPAYAETIEDIFKHLEPSIKKFTGEEPMFLAGQAVSWSLTPANLQKLKEMCEALAPGKVEVLRADHFFALLAEHNGLPYNLALSKDLTVTASDNTVDPMNAVNGSPSGDNKWVSKQGAGATLTFDLGGQYELSRYVVRHAGFDWEDESLNTRDFTLQVSMDGDQWATADQVEGNTQNVTDIDLPPIPCKYVRLTVQNPGEDGVARIGDVELYGRKIK